jgi:protein subunit release factor B
MVEEFKEKFATDIKSLLKEVKVDYYKSTGPGGQKKNKKASAVRLRHIPSGIIIIATEYRSQAQNKKLALERLQKKLIELNKEDRPRIPTKKPYIAKVKILEEKERHSLKKKLREKVKVLEEQE